MSFSVLSKSHNSFSFHRNSRRARRNNHRGGVVWFTGLSGAGKSTLARLMEGELFARGMQVSVLDGDNLRRGLNSDLGFAPADRVENIRRAAEVANVGPAAAPDRLDRGCRADRRGKGARVEVVEQARHRFLRAGLVGPDEAGRPALDRADLGDGPTV